MLKEAFQMKKMRNLEKVPRCPKVSEEEKYDFIHFKVNKAKFTNIFIPIYVKKVPKSIR